METKPSWENIQRWESTRLRLLTWLPVVVQSSPLAQPGPVLPASSPQWDPEWPAGRRQRWHMVNCSVWTGAATVPARGSGFRGAADPAMALIAGLGLRVLE